MRSYSGFFSPALLILILSFLSGTAECQEQKDITTEDKADSLVLGAEAGLCGLVAEKIETYNEREKSVGQKPVGRYLVVPVYGDDKRDSFADRGQFGGQVILDTKEGFITILDASILEHDKTGDIYTKEAQDLFIGGLKRAMYHELYELGLAARRQKKAGKKVPPLREDSLAIVDRYSWLIARTY